MKGQSVNIRMHSLAAMVVIFSALVSQVARAETEILNAQSPRRVYWRNGNRVAGANGKYRVPHDRFEALRNPDPPTNWTTPDFKDGDWAYVGLDGSPDFGSMPMICSRARFGVSDPAKVSGLFLKIAFRGGVIVYVNGKELGRSHLPGGPVTAETLAEDYPDDVLLKPDGKQTRSLTLAIPASALRMGINILAIENHRAASHKGAGYGNPGWPTSGMEAIRLTAQSADGLVPNIARQKGVQVWNAGLMTMTGLEVSTPDPLVELKPIQLYSPLAGDGSGQVVVSADELLTGLAAACSDLTGPEGAKIPAGALRVRYAQSGGSYVRRLNPFDALTDQPMARTNLQPVWVTATVPASAKPGTYTGMLSLSGPTTTKVPLEMTVYGWTLPDPKQWKTKTSFFQSPENLAKYYKVPLWSDAHFKLIEQSLVLQGKLGDKVAHVLAVGADTANASLGAETMVLFKREGNHVTPDFSAVERYLKLYKKYVGDPVAVILHVWTIHVDWYNPKKDRSTMVTFRMGDQLQRGTLPPFEDPSIAGLWDEVVAGMKRAMKSLDWPESALQFGMSEDSQPSRQTTAFFAKHFPDIKWALISHMQNLPPGFKLGLYYGPAGFGDYTNNRRGWREARTWFTLQRAFLDVHAPLTTFRFSPLAALFTGASGPGGDGMDRWEDKATGCYGLKWGQIMRGNPSSLLAPGAYGPIPTVRYELMRAGSVKLRR